MRLMQFDENDNEISADALYFDGYSIGERQLEGLPIKVTLNAAGTDIEITANWPRGASKSHWAPIAKQFALQNDVFSTTPELDNDDGFIDLERASAKPVGPKPIAIKAAHPFG
jgi:hypothetical protein